jgi:hypothetical protein
MSKSFRTGISVSGSSIFSGSLTASFANISGSITTASITSTSGSISGWVLSNTAFTAGSGASATGFSSSPDSSGIFFYAGGTTASSAPLRISNTGNITASAGTHNFGLVTTNTAVSNGLNPGLTVASTDNVTANWNAITISRSGVQLGSIRVASVAGAPTLVSGSDYRLKENIEDSTEDFVNVIKNLRPVTYKWKNFDHNDKINGFIAHEVQLYIPEAVDGKKDAVDEDGNIIPQTLTQQPFVFYLVGALKEDLIKIDELQVRLDNAGL